MFKPDEPVRDTKGRVCARARAHHLGIVQYSCAYATPTRPTKIKSDRRHRFRSRLMLRLRFVEALGPFCLSCGTRDSALSTCSPLAFHVLPSTVAFFFPFFIIPYTPGRSGTSLFPLAPPSVLRVPSVSDNSSGNLPPSRILLSFRSSCHVAVCKKNPNETTKLFTGKFTSQLMAQLWK